MQHKKTLITVIKFDGNYSFNVETTEIKVQQTHSLKWLDFPKMAMASSFDVIDAIRIVAVNIIG